MEQWYEVADIQSNWIGTCDVYRFKFPLRSANNKATEELLDLRVKDPVSVGKAWFIVIQQGHPQSDTTKQDANEPCKL